MHSEPNLTHNSSDENDPREERMPYEPPVVESVKLTDEAAESLT